MRRRTSLSLVAVFALVAACNSFSADPGGGGTEQDGGISPDGGGPPAPPPPPPPPSPPADAGEDHSADLDAAGPGCTFICDKFDGTAIDAAAWTVSQYGPNAAANVASGTLHSTAPDNGAARLLHVRGAIGTRLECTMKLKVDTLGDLETILATVEVSGQKASYIVELRAFTNQKMGVELEGTGTSGAAFPSQSAQTFAPAVTVGTWTTATLVVAVGASATAQITVGGESASTPATVAEAIPSFDGAKASVGVLGLGSTTGPAAWVVEYDDLACDVIP